MLRHNLTEGINITVIGSILIYACCVTGRVAVAPGTLRCLSLVGGEVYRASFEVATYRFMVN